MKTFETVSTRYCGLAVLDFLMRVKARVNSIHFGTVRAAVLYIMFHCLEISFLLNRLISRMNFLFTCDPLSLVNVRLLQNVKVCRQDDLSLHFFL